MPRPQNKEELIEAANANFRKLWDIVESMPQNSLDNEFDFSDEPKKKEAHWKRDKNLRDVLVHLYEWHQLLLKWIDSNTSGNKQPFLPEPYTWKTYGDMNVKFWEKHQSTKLEDSKIMLNTSHNDVLTLIQKFSNEELFTKKYYDWTGTTTLGSYCVSSLSSHYDWAIKKLRAHIKKTSKK